MNPDRGAEIAQLVGRLIALLSPPEAPAPVTPPLPKLLVSFDDAAERLSIGRTKLYQLVREHQIKTVRIGRLHRVRVIELERDVDRLGGQ
jgi:excisionase family DNA binding protein